jgi:hypothetical protein
VVVGGFFIGVVFIVYVSTDAFTFFQKKKGAGIAKKVLFRDACALAVASSRATAASWR